MRPLSSAAFFMVRSKYPVSVGVETAGRSTGDILHQPRDHAFMLRLM